MGPSEGGFHAPKMKGTQLKIWKFHEDQDIYLYPIMNLLPYYTLRR